ncbi:MAG: hypothetical protein DMF81_00080, partial [Acidobacteria bacterium]
GIALHQLRRSRGPSPVRHHAVPGPPPALQEQLPLQAPRRLGRRLRRLVRAAAFPSGSADRLPEGLRLQRRSLWHEGSGPAGDRARPDLASVPEPRPELRPHDAPAGDERHRGSPGPGHPAERGWGGGGGGRRPAPAVLPGAVVPASPRDGAGAAGWPARAHEANVIDPQKIHRLARWLHLRRVRLLPGLLQRWNYFLTGCDLPGSVRIGRGVRFQHHGAGVIVHPRTVIGDDVMIHPQVVIGQNVRHREPVDLDEIVIGEGAQLGAGAKIIASGRLEIGARADVGANAVVLESVPPGCTVVGVPARVVRSAG